MAPVSKWTGRILEGGNNKRRRYVLNSRVAIRAQFDSPDLLQTAGILVYVRSCTDGCVDYPCAKCTCEVVVRALRHLQFMCHVGTDLQQAKEQALKHTWALFAGFGPDRGRCEDQAGARSQEGLHGSDQE